MPLLCRAVFARDQPEVRGGATRTRKSFDLIHAIIQGGQCPDSGAVINGQVSAMRTGLCFRMQIAGTLLHAG